MQRQRWTPATASISFRLNVARPKTDGTMRLVTLGPSLHSESCVLELVPSKFSVLMKTDYGPPEKLRLALKHHWSQKFRPQGTHLRKRDLGRSAAVKKSEFTRRWLQQLVGQTFLSFEAP